MDSIIVCPFCHKGFRDSLPECPAPDCKEAFNKRDWPVPQAYSPPEGKRPKLVLKWDDNEWSPDARTNEFHLGREPDSDVPPLNKSTISRKHARVFWNGGAWTVDCVEKEDGRKTVVKIIKAGRSGRDSGEEILSETVLSTRDIIAIDSFHIEVMIDYSPDFIRDSTRGRAQAEDISLNIGEPVHIGSDRDACRVVVGGAAPVHAVIYSRKDGSWWIADCDSAAGSADHGRGTKVNGVQIRNEKLEDLDKITVAGVDILFDGNTIHVGNGDVLGVDVLVRDVSVAKNGRDILKDISFYAEPGDFIGILGPSGCGKSSLIQRLVGLGGFDQGEVRINNVPYGENKETIQSFTAYIPQDVALHDNLTVEEEMNVFCLLHLTPDNDVKHSDALKRVHLDGKEKSRVGALSGGEKRRLSIALELLRAPHLLCLDEPTAGLDPATETDIMMLLRRIANQSRTVLCSTHIMGNIQMFDRILFLAKGRVLFFGTPSELMNHFNASSPLELYRKFGRGTLDDQIERAENESARYRESARCKKYQLHKPNAQELPAHSGQAGFVRQLNGYLLRQFYDFISFRHSNGVLKNFLHSALFMQLLVQPILVALVLKLACAHDFTNPGGSGHRRLYFFFSVAVFWLGMNGAIRELVKERTPWRCLERLAHVSMSGYLLSKIFWEQLLCAVQVGVFSLCIFLRLHWKVFDILNPKTSYDDYLPFMWTTVFVLYLVCSLGTWIALMLSASCKKESTAVGWLPIIIIPVLFFSEPIIKDDTFEDGFAPKYEESMKDFAKGATVIERIMPGFASEMLLERAKNHMVYEDGRGRQEIPWNEFFWVLSAYMAVFMGLMILCQGKNERQWEGR